MSHLSLAMASSPACTLRMNYTPALRRVNSLSRAPHTLHTYVIPSSTTRAPAVSPAAPDPRPSSPLLAASPRRLLRLHTIGCVVAAAGRAGSVGEPVGLEVAAPLQAGRPLSSPPPCPDAARSHRAGGSDSKALDIAPALPAAPFVFGKDIGPFAACRKR